MVVQNETEDRSEDRDQQIEVKAPPSVTARKNPCPVVGIGASAGGLEAFQELFSHMPAASGMAFVLIQHLDPRHETLMPELLARHTAMPVRLVSDETRVETDHVYVIPPNATLTIDDCTLRVTRLDRARGRRMPIDNFFRSLAEDQGDDAVGIILSGTGTDGALGLKAIKEQGGLTLVQAPTSARYDSMPRAALLTGMADAALPVAEMPARLLEHIRSISEARGGGPDGFREELETHLSRICALLRRKTGHDFSRYKRSTLIRRIRRRMGELRAESVALYLDRLGQDAKEVDQLFRDLLISVTNFFRDPAAFEALARKVVPKLFEKKGLDGQVRVWVPGCATGEEAYSLAILLREHAEQLDEPPQIQVFATDIDPHALETARQAMYPERIEEQVAKERLARFFVRHGNMYQVAKEIREMCLFSTHNLITDPPFSRLDLISCRNLLIYLESDLQKRLVPLCHYSLRSGGFLFLGPSESVVGWPELFRAVDRRHRIFQSKDVVLRPPVSFPLAERSRFTLPRWHAEEAPPPSGSPAGSPAREPGLARTLERILLESYSPACVLINERGEIAYFSPRTGRYLEAPAGTPTLNVLDLVRRGLRTDLRTALHRSVTGRVTVTQENVPFEVGGETQRINLVVRPMSELGGDDPSHYMVIFQEIPGGGPADVEREGAAHEEHADAEAVIRRLEGELRNTKEHLQAALEELESANEELISSNEELLSINEELQSTNEELQTSKEELQSVNEELETINAELKKKIDELDRASSDLLNLFQSTQIATIFVDRELRIKKFTPAATDVFRLIDSDVGRLIADIAPRFTVGGDLLADIRQVLRTLSPRERHVRLVDEEAWYILRILPYRTVDNLIDGVVMTFVDVTELRWVQEQNAQLARIVEFSQDAILGKTLDGTITSWNAGAEKMYGYTAQEVIGRSVGILIPDHLDELGPILDRLRLGQLIEPFETERVCKDGRRIWVLLTVSPMIDGTGQVTGASAIARDITDRRRAEEQLLANQQELTVLLENARRAEEALKEAAHRKDEFLAMLGHELRNPLAPIRNCLYVLSLPNATAAQAERARTTIERQVAHLTRLVDDLLDVSRISQGKILLRKERLDAVGIVRTTVEDHRGALVAAGLTLDLDVPPGPLWVSGDPTRLSQMVGNVLHNAAKFTDRGGRVGVQVKDLGGEVLIAVRDTGIGIEPEVLARLFEPFSQAPPGLDRSRGGLGLGLALVRRLAELHNGVVEASSAGIGRGSEVSLRLPLDSPPAEPAAAAATGEGERSRRCLLIEDNHDAAESMALLLQLSGHEVETAFDGMEGLAAARRFRPQIVLCDIGLPGGMDGYAVARAFREQADLGAVYLIALTGYGQEEDQRRAREAGFDVHLTKPADLEVLRRLIAGCP
jgi:two-component system CheB/CheR fusion protein